MTLGRIAVARAPWRMLPPLDIGAGDDDAQGQPLAWTLFLCVAAVTGVRLIALAFSRTELFFDEAQYWFWSRELAFGYYSKPPLIAWLIRASTEICGMGEACVRAPAPLLHGATAMLIYGIGRTLYGARAGFWAGLVYVTLPGVSFSSTLISTDAPLLFFVALSLLSVTKLGGRVSWGWAVALGVGIGGGLLSKYAMSYFLLGLALYGAFTREGRALWRAPHIYVGLAIGAAILAPNIVWNASNRFATFSHTADNAAWSGALVHPQAALEFLIGQMGVFGPVLFVVFVIALVKWARRVEPLGAAERMLLAFSVPVLALMTFQAFVSRAHANWAAFAYIAATVLITATLLRGGQQRLFRFSLGLHLVVFVMLSVGGLFAGGLALPRLGDPYARMRGWKAVAELAGAKAEAEGFRAIATDRRSLAAETLYYLRGRNLPIVALRQGEPHDHFELTRPLTDATPRPVLLVSFNELAQLSTDERESQPDADDSPTADADNGAPVKWAVPVGTQNVIAGGKRRVIHFYAIKGNVD